MTQMTTNKVKVITSPGFDGVPFRGETVPDLTRDGTQPIEVLDAKVRIFDLSNAEQLAEYSDICDSIAKGFFVMSREELQWVPDKNNWMAFIRFLPRYSEMPGKVLNRMNYDTSRGYINNTNG